jgi:hypothetical protein
LGPKIRSTTSNTPEPHLKKTFIAIALALAAVAAHAAPFPVWAWNGHWYQLDSSVRGDVSITSPQLDANGTVTFWMRTVLHTPKLINGVSVSEIKTHVAMNCSERTTRDMAAARYNAAGHLTWSTNTPGEWAPIVPDTEDENAYHAICHQAAQ